MRTVNKRGLKVGLFAVISFLSIGLMGNSEAVGINLPTSIHDILSPEQIAEIKKNPAILEIQQGMRKQSMSEQAVVRSSAMMGKGAMSRSVTNAVQEALIKRMQPEKVQSKDIDLSDETGSTDS